MHTTEDKSKTVPRVEVLVYYFLAVAVSAPFRLGWINLSDTFPLPGGFSIIYRVLGALGPAVGYLILFYVLKSKVERSVTFFGSSKLYSIISLAVIPLVLGIMGWENDAGIERHWYGFLTGLTFGIYAIGEELGWRGYLQQALSPLPIRVRILLIATMWYLWHLNFLNPSSTIKDMSIHFGSLVLGSWALLMITRRTHSILVAAAVHLAFNIIGELGGEMNQRLIVLGVAVAVWVFVIRRMAQMPFTLKSDSNK